MGEKASPRNGRPLLKLARALGKAPRLLLSPGFPAATGPQAHVRAIHSGLAALRFFTFALGVGFTFFWHGTFAWSLPVGLLVGLAGWFSLLRVMFPPFLRWRSPVLEGVITSAEVPVAVVLVVATGGLNSPFIVYSFLPILTAGSAMGMRVTAAVSAATILPVVGAHIFPVGLTRLPSLISGNYLAFGLLYVVSGFLLGTVPYLTNLNLRRHIASLAADMERARLRREVHDETAQTIAFLRMMLQRARESRSGLAADQLADVIAAMERAHVAVRDYLDGTEDTLLSHPLGVSLRSIASEVRETTGLPIATRVSGLESALPPVVKRHLLKIAREALANVAKHAFPSSVSVSLEWGPSEVTLRVRDNGRGFSPTQVGRLGLNTMRHRAELIGASLTISSSPGQGTEVVALYPIDQGKVAS